MSSLGIRVEEAVDWANMIILSQFQRMSRWRIRERASAGTPHTDERTQVFIGRARSHALLASKTKKFRKMLINLKYQIKKT